MPSDQALSDLNASKNNFLELTHELNNYNEIYNTNSYLRDITTGELDKLSSAYDDIRTNLLKQKQEYMAADYALNLIRVRVKIMMWTLVVVCVVLFIVAVHAHGRVHLLLNPKVVATVCALIVLSYFVTVYLVLRGYTRHRARSWDQIYWKPTFN